MKKTTYYSLMILFMLTGSLTTQASKLIKLSPVDRQCLVLHFQDGYIEYNWDDTTSGSCNGWDYYHTEQWALCNDKDQYIPYGEALETAEVQIPGNFTLISSEDENVGSDGLSPVAVHRKSKVWEAGFDDNMPAMHHWIYLELASPLVPGKEYTLKLDPSTNSDSLELTFIYDEFSLESPSIKISNLGYEKDAPHKFADVYLWMGDGGEKDFSAYTGAAFHLYNVETKNISYSGNLDFRMENRDEPRIYKDFTGADIWECDFSSFNTPGTYRLVIEGIGSSPEFILGENRFEEAFKVSMQGMFYQRMGCEQKPAGDHPMTRRPLFKQRVEPEGFTVKISNRDMVTGDNPDNRGYYSSSLTGEIAEATWGGWADAYDNDQRPNNFICVFDILLTYLLTPEAFTDNQLYIPETGNGIPDILDEALWEIDWWLRMRDSKGGYLTGLTNIKPPENINYAGAPCAWQGWCVAAGSAMVAECFRIAGNTELMEKYRDSAITAYNWAENQNDLMLNTDVAGLRGKDLKMTAASFLYNLTGDISWESIVNEISIASTDRSLIRDQGDWEQQYATLGYLLTPQEVNYPELQSRMKKSIINQAKTHYVNKMNSSPTKAVRWTDTWEGVIQTSNEVSLVAIAHKLADNEPDREFFEKGLYAEAEWTLGRNPLGLVQMTGLTDRSVTQTFAPGRRDGYEGVTPGWTPFMCRDGWKNSDNIVRCEWYTNRNYPQDKTVWPWGEHFWNSRYNVPNSEATPQQIFRQKILLYGYIFGKNRTITGIKKKANKR